MRGRRQADLGLGIGHSYTIRGLNQQFKSHRRIYSSPRQTSGREALPGRELPVPGSVIAKRRATVLSPGRAAERSILQSRDHTAPFRPLVPLVPPGLPAAPPDPPRPVVPPLPPLPPLPLGVVVPGELL